jgi:protein disulfide-isomerase A6
MKPAWDKLGEEFAGSKSVLIADVDCTVEQDLCSDNGVQGYPTIKYKADGEWQDYSGGRDFDSLKKFTEETLGSKCDVATKEGCDEKQTAYIEKMTAKGTAEQQKELDRLKGMTDSKMTPDKKQWLGQRVNLLSSMVEL